MIHCSHKGQFTVIRDRDRLNCAGAGRQELQTTTVSRRQKIQELFTPCSHGADCKLFGRNRLNQALFSQQHVTSAGHTACSAERVTDRLETGASRDKLLCVVMTQGYIAVRSHRKGRVFGETTRDRGKMQNIHMGQDEVEMPLRETG